MFVLESSPFGEWESWWVKGPGIRMQVLPQAGALLNALEIKRPDGSWLNLVEGVSDPSQVEAQAYGRYLSSLLFPFPNRVAEGNYTFQGDTEQLALNHPAEGHAIHGLVYNQAFRVRSGWLDENEASLELSFESDGSLLGYPYPFVFFVNYILSRKGLSIENRVVNIGPETLPFGLGWHPYFRTGSSVNDLILTLPAEKAWEVNSRMIPTGETRPYPAFHSGRLLHDTQLDTGFTLASAGNTHHTLLSDTAQGLHLDIWQQAGTCDYLQVYTPPHRQSIAIEPMTCLADAFNNQEGLRTLAPGAVFETQYGVWIETTN